MRRRHRGDAATEQANSSEHASPESLEAQADDAGEGDLHALQSEIEELRAELELERNARNEAIGERDAALAAAADGEQRVDELINHRVEELMAREHAVREAQERLDANAASQEAEIAELRQQLAEANAMLAAARASAAEAPPADEIGEPDTGSERPSHVARMLRGRRERSAPRARLFFDRPGKCAVCARELLVADESELLMSGWTVRDGAGLCPTCRADGWLWPEEAPLPYRRVPDTSADEQLSDAVGD